MIIDDGVKWGINVSSTNSTRRLSQNKGRGKTFNFQQKKGLGSQSDFIDYLSNLPRQKSGLVNRLKEMQRTTCLLLRLHGAEIETIV